MKPKLILIAIAVVAAVALAANLLWYSPEMPVKVSPVVPQENTENAIPVKLDANAELKRASEEFVNTIAGILAAKQVKIVDKNVEELEQIINLLREAKEKIDYDEEVSLNKSSEVRSRLNSLRDKLDTRLVELSGLRVPAPNATDERYVILSGLWIMETRLALENLERFKADGANSILIIVPLDCDEKLNFSTPTEEAIAMYVQAAHRSGMRVVLTVGQGAPAYYSRGWQDAFFNRKVDYGGDEVLSALTPLVIRWANFAGRYGVEVFMPLLEPIMWASMMPNYWEMSDQQAENVCRIVSNWMQGILPEMRERYSGRLMFATHNRVGGDTEFFKLDFSGYDYICNWEAGEEVTASLYKECRSFASCIGIIHHITLYIGGVWFEPAFVLTEDEQAEAYDEYFRRTWNNELTAGVMLELGMGKEYYNRPAERVIESWLKDVERVPSTDIDPLWRTEGLFEMLDNILSPNEVTFSERWLVEPGK